MSDNPTLYERIMQVPSSTPIPKITLLKQRWGSRPPWIALHPVRNESIYAPTHKRLVELVEREWKP